MTEVNDSGVLLAMLVILFALVCCAVLGVLSGKHSVAPDHTTGAYYGAVCWPTAQPPTCPPGYRYEARESMDRYKCWVCEMKE